MQRSLRSFQLLLLFSFLLVTSLMHAQSGKFRGTVKDASTGDALPGSNLIIKELSIGAAADFDGNFVISSIPAGTHTITVSYLGMDSKDLEITIVANRTLEMDIELEPQVIEGEEVLITAQASAQQQAMNQQLTSKTIKNIVSNKQIQQLPEANAAEAVGRLPGVSLERNGGEGTKVVIRGMSAKYSLIQIDGVNMTATGEGDRSTDLSMISPYMLEGIELTKSVMANQEATATGGIVNFRIKKAPDQMQFNVIAQGGYNGLRDAYKDYKLSLGGSDRFFDKSLGVYAQFDYENTNRSSHQLGGVNFYKENTEAPVRTNQMQLMDIYRYVERIGATAVVDYSLGSTELKLSNFFSRINREETNYTTTYNYDQNNFGISLSDTPESELTILTNSLQIDQELGDFEINAILSHSYSENILPARIGTSNGRSPSLPLWNGTDHPKQNVDLDPTTIPDSLLYNLDDAVKFMFVGNLTHTESETFERDLGAELNLSYKFNIADNINVKLSFGGKVKHKKKEYDVLNLTADNAGGSQSIRDLIYDNFENELGDRTKEAWAANNMNILLEDFLTSHEGSGDFLDGRYDFGKTFDKDMYRKIHDLVMETYIPNNPDAWAIIHENFITTNYSDYHGTEDYHAFYIMPEISIGNDLMLVPGVRYEKNRTEYTGYRGNRLGVLRDWEVTPIDTVTKVRENEFFLPMIQLFYKPTDYLTVKAGYTHTLQRPNYNNIMPGWVITNNGSIDNLSNFKLKPEKSRNWDLQVSFHSDKIGLISVGAFHKKITDMIFWAGRRAILDTAMFDLPTIMNRKVAGYNVNNEFPAENYGFEIEWQSNFWYLPGLLSGLVINVNYTHNKSEAEYLLNKIRSEFDPKTWKPIYFNEDTSYTSRMINQPDHLLNLTIGYDYKGFSVRWATRYTSGIFKSADRFEELRAFSDDFLRFDLAFKQQLPVEGMELFLNINNLTNEQEQDVINHMNFTRYLEDYGRTANLGFRYQF